MRPLESTIRLHDREEFSLAFRALIEAVAAQSSLRAAFWLTPEGELGESWPQDDPLAADLHNRDAQSTGGETEDLLRLPLPLSGGSLGLLAGPSGSGFDVRTLEPLVQTFDHLLMQQLQLQQIRRERDDLRRRAEESEALHVLGLAANRSLDPDEVLDLVARFTRTLLGAHYVTVTTSEGDLLQTAAAVGVRTEIGEQGDLFAARVIDAGKPLEVTGEGDEDLLQLLSFHQGEGMRAGLGVPLSLFGETFGALVVGYRRPYPLQPRDTRLALTLAGHAAVAISNARLHRTLADRSRELERAYEELRWSSEAKERFFASMSHELRTPLNAILGYQSLLLDGVVGTLSSEQQNFVENANRATRGLLRLVNDVLDLSKIEAGKVELSIQPVDLPEIVREAMATIQPLADAKAIDLQEPQWPELGLVSTDAERVQQILLNLLSNAVKFTEEGSVEVAVELVPTQHSRWIDIRVSDTGPGIAPQDQERIFHEFEQVIGATARGGTGLGLPISRKLARVLGGDLLLDSAKDQGATFVLRLPLNGAPEAGTGVAEHLAP